jgi:hypothetical protein
MWNVEPDGIRIHETKSPAADRVVPRVGVLVKPATGRLAFYRHLRLKSGDTVSPCDLRRSYAQWLDLARIPQEHPGVRQASAVIMVPSPERAGRAARASSGSVDARESDRARDSRD